MSQPNNDQTTDKGTGDATSAFRADFLDDLDTSADGAAEAGCGRRRVAERLGNACREARPQRRIAVPAGSASHIRRRHPDSDIFLDDVSVSRRHAQFRRENGEYLVVDTGSLNGTYVNRKPAESVALANGDEIQMGKFRLVFLTRPTTH